MQVSIAELFTGIADKYDVLNRILSLNEDRLWRRRSVASVQVKENARILDLCTGTAETAIEFVRRSGSCRVFAVDFSRRMLERAAVKINRLKLSEKIRLVEADAFALPFREGSFDIVSISFGLRNLADCKKGLGVMGGMLKRGGKAVILEFSPPSCGVLSWPVKFYIKTMVPFIAWLFGASLNAYRYLSSSISNYLYPGQVLKCMESSGFKNPFLLNSGLEVVNSYYGEKD